MTAAAAETSDRRSPGIPFRKILVPVDLSHHVRPALDVVRFLAESHGASVTLFHVVEIVDVPFEELKEFYGDLERKAESQLKEFARPLSEAGIEVEVCVTYGKRARDIVLYAEEHDFDLIVLRSHRLTPENLQRGLMTISHQVVMAAQTPVLVVKD